MRLDLCNNGGDRLVESALDHHWVCTRGNVAKALSDERLAEDHRSGGAVTGDIVRLGSNFLQKLCAHVLKVIFELNVACNGYTVIGDGWCAELLVQHHVATLWADRDLYRVGELVDPALERATCRLVKYNLLCHSAPLLSCFTYYC